MIFVAGEFMRANTLITINVFVHTCWAWPRASLMIICIDVTTKKIEQKTRLSFIITLETRVHVNIRVQMVVFKCMSSLYNPTPPLPERDMGPEVPSSGSNMGSEMPYPPPPPGKEHGTRDILPPLWTDKHLWKHYLPATSLAGCKMWASSPPGSYTFSTSCHLDRSCYSGH